MIGLIQRVSAASVVVGTQTVATINHGLLVLVGVQRGDTPLEAGRLAERLVNYRVFADKAGRMNVSLAEHGGALLLVPQFTLAADTRKGTRPGFSRAAEPESGAQLFAELSRRCAALGVAVECGIFGADMQVSLVNDGPVTFWLEIRPQDSG